MLVGNPLGKIDSGKLGFGAKLSLDTGKPLKKGGVSLEFTVPKGPSGAPPAHWLPRSLRRGAYGLRYQLFGHKLKLDDLLFKLVLVLVVVQLYRQPLPSYGLSLLVRGVTLIVVLALVALAKAKLVQMPTRTLLNGVSWTFTKVETWAFRTAS